MSGHYIIDGVLITEVSDDIDFNTIKILGMTDDLRPYTNEGQTQLLQKYDRKRDIEDQWGVLVPLVIGLTGKREAAINAIICYTRGKEAITQCTVCANEDDVSPIFKKCIGLPGEFGSKCANCIFFDKVCEEEEL